MAYKIKLGTFSKKDNSTAQPNTTGWAEYDIVFKNGADIVNPTVTISEDFSTVSPYNYAVMGSRYYWIRRKTILRTGYTVLDLQTDVLATYKTEIGSTPMYILRASAAYDGGIRDSYYPPTTRKSLDAVVFDDYPYTTFSGGVYVMAVAGANTGASTLYQLSPAQFTNLINALMGVIDGTTAVDVIEAIKNSIFEPMRYINSVMWFPKAFSTSGTANVVIGKWQSGVSAGIISDTVTNIYYKSVTIPKHPQAAARGNYLNCAPYTQYVIEWDPFGTVNLDTAAMAEMTTIEISVYVDALTGQGLLKVRGGSGSGAVCLASITTQLGVPVRITSQAAGAGSVSGLASAAGMAVLGAATLNPITLGGAALAGISSIAEAITGSVSNVGSSGSIAANEMTKFFTAVFYEVAAEDNARNGRPYCQIATPSALTGFMIASKGDVAISGTLPEEEEVRAYMEAGFYYE